MEFEQSERAVPEAAHNDVSATLREGAWNKPEATGYLQSPARTNTAFLQEAAAPTFVDSSGSPVTGSDLSTLAAGGQKTTDGARIELAFLGGRRAEAQRSGDRFTTISSPADIARNVQHWAHDSVGKDSYGNKVPRDAKDFKNMDVPINLQCASTSSEWLIKAGFMTNYDYKIRVTDMMAMLPDKGFRRVDLKGNADFSNFPDGPIGFIAGLNNNKDNSNHIGYIEKRDGEIRIIHNDYKTGRPVDQKVTEKFYNPDGTPAYDKLALFLFPR